jgi:hypothetical protein
MDVKDIERLIKISKDHPLMPETYIPWHEVAKASDIFLPEILTSLQGLELYGDLSPIQKIELGRHELVQVISSYAWGEGLFCLFMTRYMLTLSSESVEYRFLLRELIEEYRHQEMFAQAIAQVAGQPIKQTAMHRFFGTFSNKYLPADYLFMGSVAIELVTDVFGNYSRKSPDVYIVLRKMFDLHNIEEARHILFTRGLLERYSAKAGYLKRTLYSYVILFNIYFLRTMYVKQEIYQRIGIENPGLVYKKASKHYKTKFGTTCLKDIIEFVDEWKGFNRLTRWAWRSVLGVKM